MLKLVTLNVERDKHWDRIQSFIDATEPDIMCLQEVTETDLKTFARSRNLHYIFAPEKRYADHKKQSGDTFEGNAVLSKLPFIETDCFYFGTNRPQSTPAPITLPEERTFYANILIAKVTYNERTYTFAATHLVVTARGEVTEEQKRDVHALIKLLKTHTPECVLVGDFNIPRGNEVYTTICSSFTDRVPKDLATSLDPDLHQAYKNPIEAARVSQFMVDYIWTTDTYSVTDVQPVFGVSDHAALVGTVRVEHSAPLPHAER